MPRKPPEEKKPVGDWRRVLRVSRGKRRRSTVVPARAPETRAVLKGGGGGSDIVSVGTERPVERSGVVRMWPGAELVVAGVAVAIAKG